MQSSIVIRSRYAWWFGAVVLLSSICQSTMAENDVTEPTTNKKRFALLRAVPKKWDLDANFKVFLDAVEMASRRKASLLVTPECWLDGYASPDKDSTPERIRAIAQPLETSLYLKRVSESAREHRMFVCFGFTSLENGRAYNASGLWNVSGERIGVYHKTHLQDHDLQYAAGESLPVWETPRGPVGMMICADRRWPETVRVLRLQGAKLTSKPAEAGASDPKGAPNY